MSHHTFTATASTGETEKFLIDYGQTMGTATNKDGVTFLDWQAKLAGSSYEELYQQCIDKYSVGFVDREETLEGEEYWKREAEEYWKKEAEGYVDDTDVWWALWELLKTKGIHITTYN